MVYCRAPPDDARLRTEPRRQTGEFSNARSAENAVATDSCQWRALPKDLPPRTTVYDYLARWQRDGTLDRMHHDLYVRCREQAGRDASPTAAVIDSQSVKSAETGGAVARQSGWMVSGDQDGDLAALRLMIVAPDCRWQAASSVLG